MGIGGSATVIADALTEDGTPMENRKTKLIRFLERALGALSRARLPKYSGKFSPKIYTQHQLAAILALKVYRIASYRDAIDLLASLKIPQSMKLKRMPHFTTIQKFFKRASTAFFHSLILRVARSVGVVAVDSTGLFTDHTSKYFESRQKSQRGREAHRTRKHTKMGVAIDVKRLLIVNTTASDGPFPDWGRLRPLIKPLTGLSLVLADKAFDTVKNYDYVSRKGAFPLIAQREGKTKLGELRRRVYDVFERLRPLYGKRWHVEIVFSALKRRFGDRLCSRKARLVKKEVFLRAWVYNLNRELSIFTCFLMKVFYKLTLC